IAQKLKTGEAAIEKKTRDRKTAAPAIERVERCYGREQTDPDQAPNQIDICIQQQRDEEIDPSRVPKMIADHVDRIGWTKPDAVARKGAENATGVLNPPVSIPINSPLIVAKFTKVKPPESHFISLDLDSASGLEPLR